jgi:hypothetical protein
VHEHPQRHVVNPFGIKIIRSCLERLRVSATVCGLIASLEVLTRSRTVIKVGIRIGHIIWTVFIPVMLE